MGRSSVLPNFGQIIRLDSARPRYAIRPKFGTIRRRYAVT